MGVMCNISLCCVAHAHDDPCPPSKAPTMGMQASELDLGSVEVGHLVQCTSRVHVRHLPGEVKAPGCTVGLQVEGV